MMRKFFFSAVIGFLLTVNAFAQLSPMPHLQFFDNSGKPCSGCKLYTYSAGTTSALATYSDSSLSTANETTITLNSAGRPQSQAGSEVAIYLGESAYKMVLKTAAGLTIWSQDNIKDTAGLVSSGLASTASGYGDELIGYKSSGTGAVGRTVHSRFQDLEFSVKDFGAIGDGITDDTAAIQKAVNAAAGGALFFPNGTYKISDTISISTDRTQISGASVYNTSILFAPTVGGKAAFQFMGPNTTLAGDGEIHSSYYIVQCSLKNIMFKTAENTLNKIAINLVDVSQFVMEDVEVAYPWTGDKSVALHIMGREMSSFIRLTLSADVPIQLSNNPNLREETDHFHFQDIYLIGQDYDYPLILADDGVRLSNITFDGFQGWNNGSDGFYWDDNSNLSDSMKVRFANVRWEQGRYPDDGQGYMFYMHSYAGLWGLEIDNCITARGNFVYLKNIINTTLMNCYFNQLSAHTVKFITAENCAEIAQINCEIGTGIDGDSIITNALTGMYEQFAIQKNTNDTSSPLWSTVFYDRNDSVYTAMRLHGTSLLIGGSVGPETAVTAPVGSLYLREDGGTNTTLYTKTTGTGNTGWKSLQERIGATTTTITQSVTINDTTVAAGTSQIIDLPIAAVTENDIALVSAGSTDFGEYLTMSLPWCENGHVKFRFYNRGGGAATVDGIYSVVVFQFN